MKPIVYKGSYFIIIESKQENKKTNIYYIYTDEDKEVLLGKIKWYDPWRKYCFYPEDNIVWDNKCLTELVEYLNELNYEYKRKKEE